MIRPVTPALRAPRHLRLLVLGVLALLLSGLCAVIGTSPAVSAVDPCGAGGNKIACENSKPGSPASEWDILGSGDEDIQGFSTDISVNVGSRIDFKIDTPASAYSITIYRLGYYGGSGARKITTVTPSVPLPQRQPQCITDPATLLYDCGNWGVSASWNVPATAVSGVYIALLERPGVSNGSHITFVVRDDSSHSDLAFQTSDPTWQAYNDYGGADYYTNPRATKVSYNRPVLTRGGIGGRDFFFSNEYPLVRFLEKNGYDVSYLAGVDTDRRGSLLTNHKTFLSVGHDEYWSGAQRANVEAARDAGVNLMFLSGNEMYWRTRYEASADTSKTAYRTLVCYKETWDQEKSDPTAQWTGTWRDPRYAAPSAGAGRPENALMGQLYMVNHDDLAVSVNTEEGKLRLWRNTSLASMPAGTTRALAPHTIGYESDEDIDNGFRPPGLTRLSTTTGPTPEYLLDFGNNVEAGTTTHHLTQYRASSGALVFAAGSVQWTWGLDAVHDSPFDPQPADVRMQQAQVNLLADMSAQPTTLDPALVPAAKSTDTTGPTTTITSPAAGATQANGTKVTVTGTAADAAGRVAGVEVSTDGGTTWHPATGTTSWSYTYVQKGQGSQTVRVRAMDDSANIGAQVTRALNVNCPCSVLGDVAPVNPGTASANDAGDYELGLRFKATTQGFVSGVRFLKGTGNGGTHTGSLWTTSGTLLARATFSNETATGWQQVSFANPVEVTPGTTYVVSYSAPQGHYAVQPWAFSTAPLAADPLAVDGGFGATPSGVFASLGRFPDQSSRNANYFVDPLFTTLNESPLTATDQWPLPGSTSVPANTTVSAKFSKAVTGQTLTLKDANGATVAGSTSYDATARKVTFTPTQPLSGFVKYTATVAGTDAQGNQVSSGSPWSFTTAKPPNAPGVCPCSLFDDQTVPTVLDSNDPSAVTLGMRFSADRNGSVTGVRFYKAPGNTGTHVGSLWTSTGTLLAEGTFANESTTGWQTLTFANPVAITKGTQYVVSYRTTVGHWSANMDQFASVGLTKSPLSAPREAGAYTYGTGFPASSSSHAYLVDVTYEKGTPSIAVTSQDPAPGALGVARGTTVSIGFNEQIQSGWSMQLAQVTSSGTTPITGTTTLATTGDRLTFKPSAQLPADSDIRVTVSGVTSTDGAALPTQTWTFHTRSPDDVNSQTLFGDEVPDTTAAADGSSVELGARFTPLKDGKVTAIRFYKGTGNGGTHVGSLWTSTGTKLAGATFTNETASGWQTANLATPVSVTAGTTYVVSYLAPQGHYARTPDFFLADWTRGDLRAPAADNGRYLYGSGGFPTNSWASTNYFVDVLFTPNAPTISIVSRSPAANADDVPPSTTPSVTFSVPITATGWSMTLADGTTNVPGSAQLSTDGRTLTFTPTQALPRDRDIRVDLSGVTSTDGATLGAQSWTFHTEVAGTTDASLLTGETPATAAANDNGPVELGMSFTPSVAGTITAIKFYKGTGNTGTHVGSLWSSTGTLLGSVTFTGESASGWQSATLSTPVAVTAGTTYVVSYYAPNGHYSVTSNYFATPRTVGPLTAPSTNNGLYRYGTGGQVPNSSWNASNYFVDVVLRYASP